MAGWFASQHGGTPIDAERICALASEGHELALQAVHREATYLGYGLANLITLFVPEAIALGGGVLRSWSLLESQVKCTIQRTCTQVPMERTEIGPALLGERLPVLGAAAAWINRYLY
jgi:glucokinase